MSHKLNLICAIFVMCILSVVLGLDKISASEMTSSWMNDSQLIAKGGHGGHGGHHGHHHSHHGHHHGHHGHHHHDHHHHHDGYHHAMHNWYWHGGNGGVWGNNPGYVYDPNYYYSTTGVPSIEYNEIPVIPGTPGATIENNALIQTLPGLKQS